jgi:hypothetical protein
MLDASIFKAKSAELNALRKLLDQQKADIRKAFNYFLRQVRDPKVINKILRAFQRGDVKEALSVVDRYIERFADDMSEVFVNTAQAELDRLQKPAHQGGLGLGELKITFDVGAKSASAIMRKSRLHLIKNISTQQKHVIRSVLSKALKEGVGPRQSARDLRQAIGLTNYQWQAVQNYRTALENGSQKVFNYTLRDKRFDRTVENVIDSDDLLDDAQIDRMVDRYTEGWLRYRSETIARTESIRTLSEARQASWMQMADELDVDPDEQIIRTWITTLDGRERDSHEWMHMQEVHGFDEPFLTPDDEELYYPGDPLADESETIQCRCVTIMRIEGDIGG